MTPDTPISSLAKNTPIITVASSGAELPAAMKLKKKSTINDWILKSIGNGHHTYVAPATSGESLSSSQILSKLDTK
jgi:hypothetical protein